MDFKKITKKQYYNAIKELSKPFNLIITLWDNDLEKCGVDIISDKSRMDYVKNFIKRNEFEIDRLLINEPQFNGIEEASKSFRLEYISGINGKFCWEDKRGNFYKAVKTDGEVTKIIFLHDYGSTISIKASII